MKLKANNRGNGYIITGGSSRKRQKLILKIMGEYLREYPGENVSISIKDNEITVNLIENPNKDISVKRKYK